MAKSKDGLTQWFSEKWVDLSRPKKGGGYEPCGRDDAKSGKYPKCVPAARAARMTPEQIESAIRRKRMAESREKREGKKPIMVSTVKKENVPTDPELYARVKADAKKKFDVYPSAYANGWLVAEYKRRGGKYKVAKESPTVSDVHVPTIMDARKRQRDLKKKKMRAEMVLQKKQPLKDPKGGLTAAGRKHFNRTTGSNLKAGVRGKADTPEKMRRKGSFLTRFFTNPSGPMVKPNGEPTRLALSANAWGEPVPKNRSDAAKLAAKGRRLLERYENVKKEEVEKAGRGDKPGHPFRGNQYSGGKGGAKKSNKAKAKAPAKKTPAPKGKPPRKSLKGVPRPKAPTKRGEPQLKTRLTILDKRTAEKAKSVKAYMMTPAKRFKKANHRSYAIERVNQMTGGKARPKGMSKKYKMTRDEVIRMETVLGKIFAAGRQKYGI